MSTSSGDSKSPLPSIITFLESPNHSPTTPSSCDEGDIHLPGVVGTSDTDESSEDDDVAAATGDPIKDVDEMGCGAVDSALVDASESEEMDSMSMTDVRTLRRIYYTYDDLTDKLLIYVSIFELTVQTLRTIYSTR